MELEDDGEVIGFISMMDSGKLKEEAAAIADKLKRKKGKQGKIKALDIKVCTCTGRLLVHQPS